MKNEIFAYRCVARGRGRKAIDDLSYADIFRDFRREVKRKEGLDLEWLLIAGTRAQRNKVLLWLRSETQRGDKKAAWYLFQWRMFERKVRKKRLIKRKKKRRSRD